MDLDMNKVENHWMRESYFDEWNPNGPLCNVRLHLFTEFPNELVWDDKDQDIGSLHSLCDFWNCNLFRHQQQKKFVH